jgi:hypothetical protein
MNNIGVIAAMYATWLRNEAETKHFWTVVSKGGTEFDEGTQMKVLDDWLRAAYENKGNRKKLSELYTGSIYAWNAYRQEKAIKSILFSTKKGLPASTDVHD